MASDGDVNNEAARSLNRLLTDLRYGHIPGGGPDLEGFVRSEVCELRQEDSFCLSRPISLSRAVEMTLDDAAWREFQSLPPDRSLSCSEAWMGVQREGLTPWATRKVICSGEGTPPMTFEVGWRGRYPYDTEVTRIRRLSEGDVRGFPIPESWEVAAQGSVGVSPGWEGESPLVSRGMAIALGRSVFSDADFVDFRLGLLAGHTSRPYMDVSENGAARTHAVEGAHVGVVPEARMYFGGNVFATAAIPVGHVFSTEGSEGWTVDLEGGVGYQLTNHLNAIVRAGLASTSKDAPVGAGTLDLAWRL